jgi:hypothetical protein
MIIFMAETGNYCTLTSSGYLMRYPHIKTRNLFSTPAEVSQLRSDLEKSTEEAFRRIDRARRQTLAEAHNIILD